MDAQEQTQTPPPTGSSNNKQNSPILKDVPKPFVALVEAYDETDRIEYDNDKIVQVKNEVNTKVNAENESNIDLRPSLPYKDDQWSPSNNTESESNIIDLRPSLPYKDDQWSPSNTTGKKIYDRDFLLALRNDPKSRIKPDNLLEAVAQENRGRVGDFNRYPLDGKPTNFTPTIRGSNYTGKSMSSQRSTLLKRNSRQVHADVKLNESENPWKPARFVSSTTMSDDDKKTQELNKKVRGILNKLTLQKSDTLLFQVRALTIDTKERLQRVIELVFEKAVNEPIFSEVYALMCKELALMQVPNNSKKDGDSVNFRKLLVTRCQLEFEKNSVDKNARNAKVKEIEECTDPEKKKELQLLLEEDDRRIRRKSVGNIRFIGELFKQHMLTVNIMIRCLNHLLINKDEESLECLCKLLSAIGKDLEEKKVDLGSIFHIIREIVDKKHGKVSRVRCMLQNVIDLRNSKWIPRRQHLNQKTAVRLTVQTLPKQNSQQGKGDCNIKGCNIKSSNAIKSISKDGDVKLNESENIWKPARFESSATMSYNEKNQELCEKVHDILNKLTPQNIDTLLVQVRGLTIDTKEQLQEVIDLVFEKAADEPNFSVAYALMCKELALMQVSNNNKKDDDSVNFRKLLATRCQLEFEKNSVDENARNAKVKEIEECKDPEKKQELPLLLEEDRLVRRKSVGSTRFIGELFKQHMLTVHIVIRYLTRLVLNKEDESLECLCTLLSIIGKDLEEKNVNLNFIFYVIGEIVDKKHVRVSSRVSLILQDVIELRNSKWIPRRQDLNPKTIDQIQEEVNDEQLTIQPQVDEPLGLNIKPNTQTPSAGNMYAALENMGNDVDKRSALTAPKPRQPPAEQITPEQLDQLERKIKNILEEYLNDCHTVDECDKDIRTSLPPSALPKLVSESYILVLERSRAARLGTGSLFANLIKRFTLSIDNYCAGLEEVLSQADGLTIDNPKIWDYLAEIIAPIINENAVPLLRLHKSFDIIKQGHAPKLLHPLFKLVIGEEDPNYLRPSLQQNSGLSSSNFMKSSQVNNFIQENQLEFLGGKNTVVSQSELTYQQIHKKLLEFFANDNSLDDIFRWIKANIGDRVREKQFVRTLATAVFEDSIVKSKLKTENLREHYSLLIRTVDGHLDYEVECLYALQALINKLEHPQGILLLICGSLYEDSVFSHDSFVKWETSDNPAEQEGKGVAVKQLTSFFTQLKEADEETSSTDDA